MKLSEIEFEIDGSSEELFKIAEMKYKGGEYYILDVPIIFNDFSINFNDSNISLIDKEFNTTLNIEKEKMEYIKKEIRFTKPMKIVILPSKTIRENWKIKIIVEEKILKRIIKALLKRS